MATGRPLVARRAQDNLQSTLAAHRAHLQPSPNHSGPPPLLPNGSSRLARVPNLKASDEVSIGNDSGCKKVSRSPRGPATRVRSCIKEARSFSAEAFDRSCDPLVDASVETAVSKSKLNSAPSSRATPRSSSTQSSRDRRNRPRDETSLATEADEALPHWRHRTEAEEEEDFDLDLSALEELCTHLNLRNEEKNDDVAPGASACLDITELSTGDMHAESENPFWALRGGQRATYELQHAGPLPHGCRLEQTPGVASQYIFTVDACDGPYVPATISFWIKIFDEFPSKDGVSVRCTKRIFHPSINEISGLVEVQGFPVAEYGFMDLLIAIRQLVLNPPVSSATNEEAAMLLKRDPEEFRRVVRTTLGGDEYSGVRFDCAFDFSKKVSSSGYPSERSPSLQMSDQTELGLMKIEVMQAQFKAYADDAMRQNTEVRRSLISS